MHCTHINYILYSVCNALPFHDLLCMYQRTYVVGLTVCLPACLLAMRTLLYTGVHTHTHTYIHSFKCVYTCALPTITQAMNGKKYVNNDNNTKAYSVSYLNLCSAHALTVLHYLIFTYTYISHWICAVSNKFIYKNIFFVVNCTFNNIIWGIFD